MLLSSDKGLASVEGYLQYARVTKRLAERTIELYAHGLAQLERLAGNQALALLDIEHTHIRRWMASQHSQGFAPRTLGVQLSCWRGFFQWLVQEGQATHNPCVGIKAPKSDKPLPKALSVDAAMALVEFKQVTGSDTTPLSHSDISPALQGQLKHTALLLDQLITELLYGCGLRVSELVGLDAAASTEAMQNGRGWIDATSAEVHVFGKGSKRRMVPLGSKAALALAQYLPARSAQLVSLGKDATLQPALLISPKGVRLTRQAVWGLLRAHSLAAGLGNAVHPHMLRHSFASHVLQSSSDLRAVQELLGHSSIASTQVYTRLDFQHLAKIYDNSHPRAKLSKEKT